MKINILNNKSSSAAITETSQIKKLFNIALWLAVFTILYNLIEGLVSTYMGFRDESLALFGFGVDSFIEVISGLGIAHMVVRIQQEPEGSRDQFERRALRITGFAFYILAAGLTATSLFNIVTAHKPETTFWGVVISLISIAVMWSLVYGKIQTGRKLNSDAILADAQCTMVCIYMSIVLLVSSVLYEISGIGYLDSIGSIVLAWFSFNEGRECYEKAASDKNCSCKSC